MIIILAVVFSGREKRTHVNVDENVLKREIGARTIKSEIGPAIETKALASKRRREKILQMPLVATPHISPCVRRFTSIQIIQIFIFFPPIDW